MSSTTAPTPVPTSVLHAVLFLTAPLARTLSPATQHALQLILTSTLRAAYLPASAPQLLLPLAHGALPPRPVYAACIAAGLAWDEWMQALGGQAMDLLILPQAVLVRIDKEVHTIWREATPAPAPVPAPRVVEAQVPISKLALGQKPLPIDLRATVTSALTRKRTLAQELLESDSESDDELFAMISKQRFIVSPTPTRERFVVPTIPARSPASSPEPASSGSDSSSRSSSPCSDSSSVYFSEDSLTSASSLSSSTFAFAPKVEVRITPPSPQRIALPALTRCVLQARVNRAPTVPTTTLRASAPTFTLRRDRAPKIFVDTTKCDVQKYLYEGGKSTVLTGGVMLGGGPAATKHKVEVPAVQRYKAPIGRPAQSATGSWRRV